MRLRSQLFAVVLLGTCSVVVADVNDVLDNYIDIALASNLPLQAQQLAFEASLKALDQARSTRYPRLTFQSRYTRAEGGRTIDIPTGDLVNPIYASLNQLTAGTDQPTQFTPVENGRFSLLREREQDTRLNFMVPVYAPVLAQRVHVRRAESASQAAQREVYARVLVRDVQVGYYAVAQADASLKSLEASRRALDENLRANRAQYEAGRATRDRVLRAQAEVLAIEQRLSEERNALEEAQRYFNFLLNRPPEADIAIVSDTASSAPEPSVDIPIQLRPELRQLEHAIEAAASREAAVRAEYLPTLSLNADYGIEGADYEFASDADYNAVSVVFSWPLMDSGDRRARRAQARLETQRLRIERDNLTQELELARRTAAADVRTQAQSVRTARARVLAADEAFRIAERRRDAGTLSQLEFLDVERALTEARLGEVAARYSYEASVAELGLATAYYPLPDALRAPMERHP